MKKHTRTPLSRTTTFIAAIAALGLSHSVSNADELTFNIAPGATVDWSDVGFWYNLTDAAPNGALPTAADNSSIVYDRTSNVTTAGNVTGGLSLATGTLDGGTLNINSGDLTVEGTLTASSAGNGATANLPTPGVGRNAQININGGTLTTKGAVTMGVANDNYGGTATLTSGTWNSQGTINLSGATPVLATGKGTIDVNGGTLTFDQTTAGVFVTVTGDASNRGVVNLSGGTINNAGAVAATDVIYLQNSVFNIDSGTFNITTAQTFFTNTEFNITGDAANINFDIYNTGGGLSNDMNFFMDSDGISTVSTISLSLLNTDVMVDGTDYEGGAAVYTLFSSISAGGVEAATAIAQNFGPGLEASFYLSGENYVMELTAIPEPGSFALLGGLFALSWVMIRRHK